MLRWIADRALSTAIIISLLIVIWNLLAVGPPDPQSLERDQKASQVKTEQKADGGLKGQSQPRQQEGGARPTAPGSPSAAPSVAAPEGQRDARHSEEEGTEFWPSFLGLKLKITDSLLAIFTFGLFVATWFLYGSTRDLVQGAERTAERQLRAYVCLVGGAVVWKEAFNKYFRAHAIFKNSGQTPGHHLMTWANIVVDDFSATPFIEAPPEARSDDPRSIIAPQGETHISRIRRMEDGDLADIRSGKKAIFFWGCVDYIDAFDQRRYFIFNCRMYGVDVFIPSGEVGKDDLGWELVPHPAGYKAN